MTAQKIIRFPLSNIGLEEKVSSEPKNSDANEETVVEEEKVVEEQVHSLKQSELEQIKKQAYDQGVEAGSKTQVEISEEMAIKTTSLLESIREKLEQLEDNHIDVTNKLSSEAATLAFEAAKKLMGEVSNIQEHRLNKFFDDIFHKIQGNNHIIVKLNAESAKLVEDKLKEIITSLEGKAKVTVQIANDFDDGQCEIDWSFGKARIDHNALLDSFGDYSSKEETKILNGNDKENASKDKESLKNQSESDDIVANSK